MERRPIAATVKTPAQNFTGDVYLTPVFNGDGTSRLVIGLVRFTPGARTNWHSHANGQLLQCTDGVGLVGARDGTAIRLRAGDTVWTPAGEQHWHGGPSTGGRPKARRITTDTTTDQQALLRGRPDFLPKLTNGTVGN